jgi:hypothetical protein
MRAVQRDSAGSMPRMDPYQTFNRYDYNLNKKKLQIREFGGRRNPNIDYNKFGVDRGWTNSDREPEGKMVFSTINKNLKLELKRHVPMYNHKQMGIIMYKESRSKIVGQLSGASQYKGMMNPVVQQRIQSAKHLNAKRHSLNLQLATAPPTPWPNTSSSIMKVNRTRDNLINEQLDGFFQCRPLSGKSVRTEYRSVERRTEPCENKVNLVNDGIKKRPQTAANQLSLQKSDFTVGSLIAKQRILSAGNQRRDIFDYDPNFVTLTKY